MKKQNAHNQPDNVFAPLVNTKPYFRCQGFAGCGKTYTAALVAVGLHRMIGSKRPIVIFDTERASKFFKGAFCGSQNCGIGVGVPVNGGSGAHDGQTQKRGDW